MASSNRDLNNFKKNIQTIIASTRCSDYVAIGSGGGGICGGSWLSGWLARGPLPRGEEEEYNDSTPVAFDFNEGDSSKVEVNGECGGDGNSNGPISNNDVIN
jgi:hypothetical protein